jgi:hypothetical protein
VATLFIVLSEFCNSFIVFISRLVDIIKCVFIVFVLLFESHWNSIKIDWQFSNFERSTHCVNEEDVFLMRITRSSKGDFHSLSDIATHIFLGIEYLYDMAENVDVDDDVETIKLYGYLKMIF